MKLNDLIHRQPSVPWECGEKIPWNDPDFSRRMLESHFSQDHDREYWSSIEQLFYALAEKHGIKVAGFFSHLESSQ